jgi:hypothetical protein
MISDSFDKGEISNSEIKYSKSSSFLTVERSRAKIIDQKLAIFLKNKTAGLM